MFFKFIGFILRYAPVIVSAITLIEGITSKDTPGEDKKELAIATIKSVLGSLGVTVTPELEKFIGQVIDVAVSILNFLGVFDHAEDAPEGEEEPTPVTAATVAKAAAVVRENPTTTRLDELEALFRAQSAE